MVITPGRQFVLASSRINDVLLFFIVMVEYDRRDQT